MKKFYFIFFLFPFISFGEGGSFVGGGGDGVVQKFLKNADLLARHIERLQDKKIIQLNAEQAKQIKNLV